MAGKGRTRKAGRREVAARRRGPLDPSLNVRGEQPYVAIPFRGGPRTWGDAGALVGEVVDWLARRGAAPAGPAFHRTRTVAGPEAPGELEAGVPVARAMEGDGRVVPGVRPAGAYAVAVHHGHPERLAETHAEVLAWVREQELRPAVRHEDGVERWEARFESFLTDPSRRPDPERWSIEIAYLLDLAPRDAGR